MDTKDFEKLLEIYKQEIERETATECVAIAESPFTGQPPHGDYARGIVARSNFVANAIKDKFGLRAGKKERRLK